MIKLSVDCNAVELQENLFLRRLLEAEKLQGILPQVSVNMQPDRRPDLRQMIKHIERDEDLVADSTDIDDDFSCNFLRQSAIDLGDHDCLIFRLISTPPGILRQDRLARPQRRDVLWQGFDQTRAQYLHMEMANSRR